MALGTNYARSSLKRDMITIFLMKAMSKGASKEEIEKYQKKLFRMKIADLKVFIKQEKQEKGWE